MRCAPWWFTAPCMRRWPSTGSADRRRGRPGCLGWRPERRAQRRRCSVRATRPSSAPRCSAEPEGGGWRLSGVADFVADADLADMIVVTAAAERAHAGVRRRHGARPGVTRRTAADDGWSPRVHRPVRRRAGRRSAAVLGGADGLSAQDLRRVANAAVALLCLDLVGVGEAVLQRTVDYTRCANSSAGRSRRSRRPSIWSPTCTSRWPAARLAAQSAVFWIGRGRTATRETAIARMRAARGQADHARCPPTARRHGLRRRHRPAPVLRTRPGAVDTRRRSRHRREMA